MPRDETPFSVKRDELRGAACVPPAAGKDKQNDPSQPRSICALEEHHIKDWRTCGIFLCCWLQTGRARRGPGWARHLASGQKQWISDPGVGRTVIHAESAARSSAWNMSVLVIDPALISPSAPTTIMATPSAPAPADVAAAAPHGEQTPLLAGASEATAGDVTSRKRFYRARPLWCAYTARRDRGLAMLRPPAGSSHSPSPLRWCGA
jgi:hypothetical protein